MRKVLLVSYHVPPRPGIGGQRPLGMYKYLTDFGWQPILVTAQLPGPVPVANGPVYQSGILDVFHPFRRGSQQTPIWLQTTRVAPQSPSVLRRLAFRLGTAFVAFPDRQIGWLPYLIRTLEQAVVRERPEIIWSCGPTMVAHVATARVARRHGLPWVADFRDLWTLNPFYNPGPVRRHLEQALERWVIGQSTAITTVSEPLAGEMRGLHPGVPVWSIPNSFDAADFAEVGRPPTSSDFLLTFTGQLYGDLSQFMPKLLRVIAEMMASGELQRERVRLRVVGPDHHHLAGLAAELGLEDVVERLAPVSYQESLRLQMQSTILLLPLWNDPSIRGTYSGKLFEYLGAQRPILMMGSNDGVAADLVRRAGAGAVVTEQAEMRAALRQWWAEYQVTGTVQYHGDETVISQFERRNMVKRFATLFDDILVARKT